MNSKNVICSRLDIAHVPKLVELLISHKITLLGFSDRHFLTHVLEDAANTGNPNIIAAISPSDDIVGWTIKIKRSKRYWQRFLLKHPIYLQKVLWAECTERLRKRQPSSSSPNPSPQTPPPSWPTSAHIEWGQNSPTVATGVDITVLEHHRNTGLAQALLTEQYKALKSDSVSRIDVRIREHNIPSQLFHIKDGWSLVKIEDGWVYVTKSIAEGYS